MRQKIKNLGGGGFTMVELLVATSVVIMVLSGIAAGVTFSIRNTTFSKEKVLSVRYAQEAIEWMRNKRDVMGWNAFHGALSADGVNFSYCLDGLPDTESGFAGLNTINGEADASNCDEISGTAYIRGVNVSVVSSTQVDVDVVVGWYNGSDYKTTNLSTILREWR